MQDEPGLRPTFVKVVTIAAGTTFIALGAWALFHPWSFFEAIAPWPPFNRHLIRDSGVFQVGLGTALILTAPRTKHRRASVLLAAGIAAGLHVVSHVLDHPLGGGQPLVDFPVLTVLAVTLLAAAAVSRKATGGGATNRVRSPGSNAGRTEKST